MTEPWNIKQDDTREADSLPTFIIFCEDEVSEPTYFKSFETSKIKVNPIKNQKSMIENVINAIYHCKEEGVMKSKDGMFYILDEEIQVWCVYDRDREETEEKMQRGNVVFDESVTMAETKGIKLAYSNDAFELWILLHFEDIDPEIEDYKNRLFYYDKLTTIFKNLSTPNEILSKALMHNTFSYKKDLKQKRKFLKIVMPEIIGKTNDAIERAKKLEEFHDDGSKHPHEKSPYTLVHHLVEELIRVGGKDV